MCLIKRNIRSAPQAAKETAYKRFVWPTVHCRIYHYIIGDIYQFWEYTLEGTNLHNVINKIKFDTKDESSVPKFRPNPTR